MSAGIIVAGWDEEEGGAVFNVPLGGGVFKQPWAIGGECFWLVGREGGVGWEEEIGKSGVDGVDRVGLRRFGVGSQLHQTQLVSPNFEYSFIVASLNQGPPRPIWEGF